MSGWRRYHYENEGVRPIYQHPNRWPFHRLTMQSYRYSGDTEPSLVLNVAGESSYLSRQDVATLIPLLQGFVQTGRLPNDPSIPFEDG